MSSATEKKRKRDFQDGGWLAAKGRGSGATRPDAIMAEMTAMLRQTRSQMEGMQAKIDLMETRLLDMDELEEKFQDQEEKCRFLEARCDSLERSVQVLANNQIWEYSAPFIPTPYWEERGFNEDDIEAMESFLKDMEDTTCSLRGVEHVQQNSICLGDYVGRVRRDDLLLPHWREFTNALQLLGPSSLSGSFSMSNIQFPPGVLDSLTPALATKKIARLTLDRIGFSNTSAGIKFAIIIMERNQCLKQFDWNNISLDRWQADNILDAIIRHPSLEAIRLKNSLGAQGVNGFGILCTLLASGKEFSYIDLDSNDIQTEGTQLPDFLATDPPLHTLRLSNNNLGDSDAMLIANALKLNTNLQKLYLHRNNIFYPGIKALQMAIFDSTSFNAVADSNHTCRIHGLAFGGIHGNFHPVIGSNRNKNRGRKIYFLLSSRSREGTNAYHLDLELGDDAIKLAPKVLESVDHYSGYFEPKEFRRTARQFPVVRKPLCIMYEILRGWQMPKLYENHV